jgi:7-cyano-7-deazaguanine synthase
MSESSVTSPIAVVLLSGGLDSAVALAHARTEGFQCHCLCIDYGQRHECEVRAARRVADSLGAVGFTLLRVDLRAIGGSALTADIDVPRDRSAGEMGAGIPVTYVPARNLVFLSLALGQAEALAAADIFLGVNAIDYSGYPDCRPEFIRSFEQTAAVATKAGVEGGHFRVHTPLISMTKAEIIRRGVALGVDFSLTHSCYDPLPDGAACGRCDSCLIRRRGFAEAGVPDPTRYGVSGARAEASQTGGWAKWGE